MLHSVAFFVRSARNAQQEPRGLQDKPLDDRVVPVEPAGDDGLSVADQLVPRRNNPALPVGMHRTPASLPPGFGTSTFRTICQKTPVSQREVMTPHVMAARKKTPRNLTASRRMQRDGLLKVFAGNGYQVRATQRTRGKYAAFSRSSNSFFTENPRRSNDSNQRVRPILTTAG